MANLLISIVVVFLILGGPMTLYFAIKVLSGLLGGLKAQFVKTGNEAQPLALKVTWDPESFDIKVMRIKMDFLELVRGGRSFSHSFTFEDASAKKKSFILPLDLEPSDLAMLTDAGLNDSANAVKNSVVSLEIETLGSETKRQKVKKKKLIALLKNEKATLAKDDTEAELLDAQKPDRWSVQTRVFPWKKQVEEVEEEGGGEKKAAAADAGGPRAPVDFIVTKVWIEPGCIVCDACENEAPLVFWVKEDTCIVRENAPLDDAAAIKAAAEGCPVDVIKYNKAPKPAEASA